MANRGGVAIENSRGFSAEIGPAQTRLLVVLHENAIYMPQAIFIDPSIPRILDARRFAEQIGISSRSKYRFLSVDLAKLCHYTGHHRCGAMVIDCSVSALQAIPYARQSRPDEPKSRHSILGTKCAYYPYPIEVNFICLTEVETNHRYLMPPGSQQLGDEYLLELRASDEPDVLVARQQWKCIGRYEANTEPLLSHRYNRVVTVQWVRPFPSSRWR